MGFLQAIGRCFSHYADFNGRARRSEYWWWYAFTMLVTVLALVLVSASIEPKSPSPVPGLILMGLVLFYFATFLPSLAVTVRRLHDSGKTGWWILICFLPGISVLLIVFMLMGSQAGENRFGPDPRNGGGKRVPAGFPAEPEDNWSTRLGESMAKRQPGSAPAAASGGAYARSTGPGAFGQRATFGRRQRAPG